MDVYRQASKIVQQVQQKVATAKSLCLEPQMQKKKQTYAVVCETLRHYDLLKDVLEKAQFFEYYPDIKEEEYLVIVMCYDGVIGRGVNTRQNPCAVAIVESLSFLKKAYYEVKDNHVIPPSLKERTGNFPRYVRVNTLKGKTTEAVLSIFNRSRQAQQMQSMGEKEEEDQQRGKRGRDPVEGEDTEGAQESKPPVFAQLDPHIPDLIQFPHGTDLHAHPLVKQGHVVLQDKASCLPAAVLFNGVKVKRYDLEGNKLGTRLQSPQDGNSEPWYPKVVIDGCAAPGNKTCQLAALGKTWSGEADDVKVLAIERDDKRVELLRNRMRQMGALNHVEVIHGDFTQLDNDVKQKAEAILLDPSCSSSGVVSRADVTTNEAKDNPRRAKQVAYLAAQQLQLLTFAMTAGHYPNVKRVVYSTCSVNVEEDEDIIRGVLSDPELSSKWSLSSIMPKSWETRGREKDEDAEAGLPPMSRCIRCDADVDDTNGFFVACFDRVE